MVASMTALRRAVALPSRCALVACAALFAGRARAQCAPVDGGTQCLLAPMGAQTPPVGDVDVAYRPCSGGSFGVLAHSGLANQRSLRYVTAGVDAMGPRLAPMVTSYLNPGANATRIQVAGALAASSTQFQALVNQVSGAGDGVAVYSQMPGGASLLLNTVFREDFAAEQGDLDCAADGKCAALVLAAAPSGASTMARADLLAFSASGLRAGALSAASGATLNTGPQVLGRPAVVYEPVLGRFWAASYGSAANSTAHVVSFGDPTTPGIPATVGDARVPSSPMDRRLALAPDGTGGVVLAVDSQELGRFVRLYRCHGPTGSPICVTAATNILTVFTVASVVDAAYPALAFDGVNVLVAVQVIANILGATVNSVALLRLDPSDGLSLVRGPLLGTAPAVASDGRGVSLFSYRDPTLGVVGTTIPLPCRLGTASCGARAQCASTGDPSTGVCVPTGPECPAPDAGPEAGPDVQDTGVDAAEVGAELSEAGLDVADAGVDAASPEAGNLDAQELLAPDASPSDASAPRTPPARTFAGGACSCATPGGARRAREALPGLLGLGAAATLLRARRRRRG